MKQERSAGGLWIAIQRRTTVLLVAAFLSAIATLVIIPIQNVAIANSEEDKFAYHEDRIVSEENEGFVDQEGAPDNDDESIYEFEGTAGTPESVILETSSVGVEIPLDYILFLNDDNKNIIAQNPSGHYNGGLLNVNLGETILLDFNDCHNNCIQPHEVRDVYLVNAETSDTDIIQAAVDQENLIMLDKIDKFNFRIPEVIDTSSNGNEQDNSRNNFNKIAIHTGQTEGIDAFYIADAVELSSN